MEKRKLHFATALAGEGWRNDVSVSIDADGFIDGVAANATDGTHIEGIAIPAVANVHSHAHQRLMAGLAEKAGPGADNFWTWREVMYGFAQRLAPEDLEAVAAQLYVEMLKAGFSAVGEFQYLHHQPDGTPYDEPAELSLRCLAAAQRAGIAITLLPTFYAHGGFGGKPAAPGQRRFVNDAEGFLRIHGKLAAACREKPLARLGIAPHSLRAVIPDLLKSVANGLEPKGPIHIHVAEQVKEVDDCLVWCGRRPVDLLLDSFDVSSRWTAIHATHLSEPEITRLARSGAVAGLCPTTEANLGDGIFPATDYLRLGGTIAIGSDSHISVSPAEDIRLLEYSQRLRDRTRNALAKAQGSSTGRTLFDAVAAGGGRSLDQPIGAIAPGCRADIAVLDGDHPALVGRRGDDILDSWIFSAGNACVKDMIVGGRHVVKDRHHVREEEILRGFRAAVERLDR
jgi:formimidoylglutamate deiminase